MSHAITSIRPALPADAEAIAQLNVKGWQTAYRGHMPDAYLDALDPSQRAAGWARNLLEPGTVVLVAMFESALLGFCSLLPSRDPDGAASVVEIAAIYVDPAHWRSGIGGALIEAALEAAKQRGFSEVSLWVLTGNSSARAFYEARQFRTDGETKLDERRGFSIHETRYRRSIA